MKIINVTALLNRSYPNEVPAKLLLATHPDGGLTIRIETEGSVAMKLILDRAALGVLLWSIADALIATEPR